MSSSSFRDGSDAPSPGGAAHRIPAAHLPAPPAPETFRHRGVLRSGQARLRSEPFEVTAEFAPDFPVAPPGEVDAEPAPEPVDVDALRAAWEAEAEQRQADAVAAAREAAYAEGVAAGKAEAEAEVQRRLDALAEDAERMHALWCEHVSRSEPLVVQLALEAAALLLDAPLPDATQAALADMLASAVERLATEAPVTVSLHPVDYLRLQESGFTAQLDGAHPGLIWAPTPSFAEGDWAVASPKAVVRRLKAELLHQLRLRLGLPEDAAP